MLEGWSTGSCKNVFGQMINSDARALQNLLKMQIFDLLWPNFEVASRTKFRPVTCLNSQ